MNSPAADFSLWRHGTFQKLFWAHVVSLVGGGLSSVALALLAHQLVGASASAVLGAFASAVELIMVGRLVNSTWLGLAATPALFYRFCQKAGCARSEPMQQPPTDRHSPLRCWLGRRSGSRHSKPQTISKE